MRRPVSPFSSPARRNPYGTPAKDKPTAPRRYDLEKLLCEAIKTRKLVDLVYDDAVRRSYQPTVVYHSTRDMNKILVGGVQISNPAKPQENLQPHNFEVGSISSLVVTTQGFVVPSDLDRFDKKYANGIICSV